MGQGHANERRVVASTALRSARRPWRDVSVDKLEHPFDRFDDHRLHLG
jgi:hypothetical protein